MLVQGAVVNPYQLMVYAVPVARDIWGIHNDQLTDELVSGNFISIGWDDLPPLNELGDREQMKVKLAIVYPNKSPNFVANQAGTLLRFRDAMKIGDLVIAPNKRDRTINIGEITGDYYYANGADTHRNRKPVKWLKTEIPRSAFSRGALAEVSSAITCFRIRRHDAEFLSALSGDPVPQPDPTKSATGQLGGGDVADDVRFLVDAPQIEQQTRDYILDTLHKELGHLDFEEFTADLLRTLGYEARLTPKNDGGVDVIAHRDPLGIEPPLIKVQCKHTINKAETPQITNLRGTLNAGEYGLFVTLGDYPPDSKTIERQNSAIRLLSGNDVVDLVLANYNSLPERWRKIIRLKPLLVVAGDNDLEQ